MQNKLCSRTASLLLWKLCFPSNRQNSDGEGVIFSGSIIITNINFHNFYDTTKAEICESKWHTQTNIDIHLTHNIILTIWCLPPTENFFFDIIFTANFSHVPFLNANLTSPQAPLNNVNIISILHFNTW